MSSLLQIIAARKARLFTKLFNNPVLHFWQRFNADQNPQSPLAPGELVEYVFSLICLATVITLFVYLLASDLSKVGPI